MADKEKEVYNGSVPLASGIKTYNEQDYPLVDAHYVWVQDGDDKTLGIRLDEKLENVGMSQEVQESIDKLEDTVNGLSSNIGNISQQLGAISGQVDLNTTDINDIKGQLEGLDTEKLGKIYRTFYNTESYMFYFYQIPAEEEEIEPSQAQVDRIISSGDYYVYQVEIKGGGGGAGIGVEIPKIKLTRISPDKSPIYLKKDSPISITMNYYGYYSATESEPETPYDDVANLVLTVNNEAVESKLITNGNYSFDIGNYLKVGQNNIKITVSITGLEAADGTPLTFSKSITWLINVVDLTVSASSFDDKALYTYPISISVPCSIIGVIDKTLHYVIDNGVEIPKPLGDRSPATSSIEFMTQDTSHGNHSIKIWVTGEIEGEEIKSNTLYFDSMYIRPGETTPILRSSYDGSDLYQYDTKTFEFSVYNPEKNSTPVEIYINGNLQTTINAENGISQTWAYRPMTGDAFDLMIKVSDDVKKEWHIKVVDFGDDISEIEGATYDFNPSLINKNNTDTDKNIYIYPSLDGNNYTFKASDNFDWYNGGWKTDENNVKYFHIMRGTSVTIDYKLFGNNCKSSGKNFKIIFQTERCKKMDAPVLNCCSYKEGAPITKEEYDEDGNITIVQTTGISKIGVEIDAQNAYLNGGNVDIKGQYMENELTELEFNINNNTTGFSEYMIYNNCDPIQVRAYQTSSSFYQDDHNGNGVTDSIKNITIGSDSCDVRLYRFKVYEHSLTMEESYRNYVADSLDSVKRAEKISRNDIFSSVGSDEYDGLDPNKIAEKHPELRMIFIECPKFTTGKKDSVKNCIVKQRMGNNDPKHNWVAKNVTMKGQGTSSEFYGPSGRNLDLKFLKSSEITDNENNEYAFESELDKSLKFNSYAMTDNSVAINYVNIKVNVASSENANNAVLADDFNIYQPYKRPMRLKNSKVRDTMEFHPCIIFVKETSESERVEFKDDKWHFYACGDFGNSKKNGNAMGMWLESGIPEKELPEKVDLECIIEFATNGELQQFIFPPNVTSFPEIKVDSDGNITDKTPQGVQVWDAAFEFRYPDTGDYLDPSLSNFEEHKASIEEISRLFKQMWDWVNSTDATKATNNSITPITYPNGVTYNKDSAEYRLAKFKYEFDNYFVSDSIIYDYLFTERHTMIDNRGKNMFIHLNVEPGENYCKWDLNFDYDNDTAEGCDNLGNLRFPYGKEDIDVDENGAKVFNSSDSVLWVNVRNCFDDRLNSLMAQSEVSGFYNVKRIIEKFDSYQWIKPERLEMMDMWRKYYRPWEEKSNNEYLWRMNGRKQFQRKRYETYQGVYIESKYGRLTSSQNINIRSYRQDFKDTYGLSKIRPLDEEGFKLNPYCDLYCTVIVDPNYTVKQRGKAGEIATLPFPSNPDAYHEVNIQIPASQYYNSVGDLAQFYIQTNLSLATGEQLKEISLGYEDNEVPDNALPNPGITPSNTMIESLDLRRNTLIDSTVDASKTPSLKYINTTGTNITTVTFANGGLLEEAYLNAVTGLTLRNLLQVKTFNCASYEYLTDLTYENCNAVIDLKYILNNAPKLNNVYLYNINLELDSTSLLNRLCDEVKTAVLTGTVTVPRLKPSEKRRYQEKWGDDLTVIGPLTNEYYISFYNYDGSLLTNVAGNRLMEDIPYDENAVLKSPLKEDNDKLPESDRVLAIYQTNTPEKPKTAKYTFTFKGWGTSLSDDSIINLNTTYVQSNMKLYAKYDKEIRMYNVYWKNAQGNRINDGKPVQVEYGQSAVFDTTLYNYPTKNSDGAIHFLFENWDQSTGYVTSDMDVNPIFLEGKLDASKDSTDYTPADIKAIIETYRSNVDTSFLNTYFKTDSIINFQMGYMPSFTNVEEQIFAQDYVLDGTSSTVKDTGISLMQEIEDTEGNSRYRNWTMALDITYDNAYTTEAQTFVHCENVVDLSIPYSSSSSIKYSAPKLTLGNMGTGSSFTISNNVPKQLNNGLAGTSNKKIDVRVRENIVIRYSYDNGHLITVFKNDRDSVSLNSKAESNSFAINADTSFGSLILGAALGYLTNYRYFSKGTINLGKIWWDDLGDNECEKIVSWTYNKQPMIFVGTGVYKLGNSNAESLASFVCYEETLNAKHKYSSTGYSAGGWKYSELRTYLNNKVLTGVNPVWKQLITEVKINSIRGGTTDSSTGFPSNSSQEDIEKSSTDILTSNSYLYVPSAYEVDGRALSPYPSEVSSNFTYPCYADAEGRKYSELEYGTNTFYQPWATRSPSTNTGCVRTVQPYSGQLDNFITILTNDSGYQNLYPFITTNSGHYQTANAEMYIVFGFSIG